MRYAIAILVSLALCAVIPVTDAVAQRFPRAKISVTGVVHRPAIVPGSGPFARVIGSVTFQTVGPPVPVAIHYTISLESSTGKIAQSSNVIAPAGGNQTRSISWPCRARRAWTLWTVEVLWRVTAPGGSKPGPGGVNVASYRCG